MSDFQNIGEGVADRTATFALLNRGYEAHQRSAGQWFETTPEMWDYFLNILPPVNFTGSAFVMSEAATESLSDAWIMVGKRAFCLAVRHGSQSDFLATVAAFSAHVRKVVPVA
jgi:hypothetical protein